jgi:NADPH-ferrihemoprotein reductase
LAHKLPVGGDDEQTKTAVRVPMFIRKSTLRLPHRAHVPVIMIGPGTGFAPFRGFIQDRHVLNTKQTQSPADKVGPMILYFGCRRSDEDYIYKDEIAEWKAAGTLTEVSGTLAHVRR